MELLELIRKPWAWYVAGPLIGLTVPTLLLIGNKKLGISSSLRHICTMCMPMNIPFFQYDWKKEKWNLVFVLGLVIGGYLGNGILSDGSDIIVDATLKQDLVSYGIHDYSQLYPQDLFSWSSLFTLRGFVMMVGGGFLVGFGTRYAGGCTSGHSIMGLSSMQWPSLVATCCFMAGGFIMSNLILPFILFRAGACLTFGNNSLHKYFQATD